LVVIGDREVQEQKVTVRAHNGDDLGSMSFNSFLDKLKKDINKRI